MCINAFIRNLLIRQQARACKKCENHSITAVADLGGQGDTPQGGGTTTFPLTATAILFTYQISACIITRFLPLLPGCGEMANWGLPQDGPAFRTATALQSSFLGYSSMSKCDITSESSIGYCIMSVYFSLREITWILLACLCLPL